MAFADYVPEMIEILREEGRVDGINKGRIQGKIELIKRLLVKKLKTQPIEKIKHLIESASGEQLESIEDNIFEISSWEEVEEIINK